MDRISQESGNGVTSTEAGFPGTLRRHRIRARLTQEQLAERAGISARSIGQLERGRVRYPRPETVRLLSAALELGPAERSRLEVVARDGYWADRCPGAGLEGAEPESGGWTVPAQLPGDVTAFTGRKAELAELDAGVGQWSGTPTIKVLSGTAGVGKSALALHWAHRAARHFPAGQLYADLRGYDPCPPLDASDVIAGFLRALGTADDAIPVGLDERAARYRTALAGRRMLVILDNAATVQQVRPLLPGTPAALVLVTSRDCLAGLVAVHGARRIELDLLPPYDAFALLRRLIGARIDADTTAAQALVERCARLPLALRVAAELASLRIASPLADLVAELADVQRRPAVLDVRGDPRAAVTTVFSWSCRYLSVDAGRLFRLLGVSPAPETGLAAATALLGGTAEDARNAVEELARAHLVAASGSDRYGMHDLMRSYAAGLAGAEGDSAAQLAAVTRLFDYYVATAATAMDCLHPAEAHRRPHVAAPRMPLTDPDRARRWLDTERPALVRVVGHAATHGWPGHAVRLSEILARYLNGGHHAEALAVHGNAHDAARDAGNRTAEARALAHLGAACLRLGRRDVATDQLHRSLALFEDTGDLRGTADTMTVLGDVEQRLGNYRSASRHHGRALRLFRRLGDPTGEAHALTKLGIVRERVGDYRAAVHLHRRALMLFRQTGDGPGQAAALSNLGDAEGRLGRHEPAAENLHQALTRYRHAHDRDGVAWTLDNLGGLATRRGEASHAADLHLRALWMHRETGERHGETSTLNGLGEATGDSAFHLEALAVAVQIGDRHQQARAHAGLGHRARTRDLCTELGIPDIGGSPIVRCPR